MLRMAAHQAVNLLPGLFRFWDMSTEPLGPVGESSALLDAKPSFASPRDLYRLVRERIRFRHYSVRTVLTHSEIGRLFEQMSGVTALMARLQYGTGMRLMECLRLGRDRMTMLPSVLVEPMRHQLARGVVSPLDRASALAPRHRRVD